MRPHLDPIDNWKDYGLRCHSVQFSSVSQSCLTLCDPMNHSTPGLPVHHQLPEFTHTHVHWVGAIKMHLILDLCLTWNHIHCFSHSSILNTWKPTIYIKNIAEIQEGRWVGGHGGPLSPWIHQEYNSRHGRSCRTPAESRQEYLTTRKVYIEPHKTH